MYYILFVITFNIINNIITFNIISNFSLWSQNFLDHGSVSKLSVKPLGKPFMWRSISSQSWTVEKYVFMSRFPTLLMFFMTCSTKVDSDLLLNNNPQLRPFIGVCTITPIGTS